MLVATSLTVVFIALLPMMQALSRTAHRAEKLIDTLNRELPPTLEALRLTGLEITQLTEDLEDSVESARNVVQNVDRGLTNAESQLRQAKITSQSIATGLKAAWSVFLNRDLSSDEDRASQSAPAERTSIQETDVSQAETTENHAVLSSESPLAAPTEPLNVTDCPPTQNRTLGHQSDR